MSALRLVVLKGPTEGISLDTSRRKRWCWHFAQPNSLGANKECGEFSKIISLFSAASWLRMKKFDLIMG